MFSIRHDRWNFQGPLSQAVCTHKLALSFDSNCLYNYSEGRGAKTENGKIACFLLGVYSRNEIDTMNSHLQKRTTNDKIWSETVCNSAYVIGAY